jgi:NTE family protein
VGLVLAGGAARGAYEVGVVQHILEDVSRDLGRDVPLDVLCGTSIGALNVCALAAFAETPRERGQRMADHWTALRIADVIRPDAREMLSMVRGLFGRGAGGLLPVGRRGGIFDPAGMESLLARFVPFQQIDENLRAGRVHGISVSTTHVGTGRTVVWAQRAEAGLPEWSGDPTVIPRAVQIRERHALASAAIPFLFPAVRIDGDYYCDGGLRQNVPLSPARRLGADGLVIVNPRYLPPVPQALEHDGGVPGPFALLGKTLNALLLDRLDNDIDRLRGINEILDAGCKLYGPGFLDALNGELGRPPGRGLRQVDVVLIRTSQDLGRLAAQFIKTPSFTGRATGMIGAVLRRFAEGDDARQADFISYLLFDGDFARQLIELGRADARACS